MAEKEVMLFIILFEEIVTEYPSHPSPSLTQRETLQLNSSVATSVRVNTYDFAKARSLSSA